MTLRDIGILFLNIILIGIAASCDSNDEPIGNPTNQPRPYLSDTTLALAVGDSTILHVINADSITSATTNAPKIIYLEVFDTCITVKALSKGEATININTHGARLSCNVKVSAIASPSFDFSKELQDNRCRFTSPSLSLYYDTPGTIFSLASDRSIEVRSLITGDHITFSLCTNPQEGNLPNATLHANGSLIELKQATLERITPDNSMWFNLLDSNDNHIVLVVTGL